MKKFVLFIILLLMFFASSCNENFVSTSYKTLESSFIVYDTAMTSVNTLRISGVMTPDQVKHAKDIGWKYYMSYKTGCDLLRIYVAVDTEENKYKVSTCMVEMMSTLDELEKYIGNVAEIKDGEDER